MSTVTATDIKKAIEKTVQAITDQRAKIAETKQQIRANAEAAMSESDAIAHIQASHTAALERDTARIRKLCEINTSTNDKDFTLFPSRDFQVRTEDYDRLRDFCVAHVDIEPLCNQVKGLGLQGISAVDRARTDTRLQKTQLEQETVEEAMILELESIGGDLERRPDLSPEIFLEFKAGTFRRDKLDRLRRKISALAGDQRELNEAIRALRSDARRASLEEREKEIARLEAKSVELTKPRDDVNLLFNACEQFLRSQGINVETR